MRARFASLLAVLSVACGGTESGTGSPSPDVPAARDAFVLDLAWADDASVVADSGIVPQDAFTPVEDTFTPVEDVPAAPQDAPLVSEDVPAATCPLPPACDVPPPTPSPTVSWRNLTTRITVLKGAARHRGRDLFLREGDPQWAIAKFAYGFADDDLNDEEVEIFLLRNCTTWERLGTAITSRDRAPHATVEGVEDTGGRVYFRIPEDRPLGVGWHRVRFVVRGDHTVGEQWIRVVPTGARFVVTDIDGTLTTDENAQFVSLLTGNPPMANPGGALTLRTLAERGYEILYLTARPEWLEAVTHTWLRNNQFPRGIVHTTLGLTGATGAPALAFKTGELNAIRARFGYVPEVGIGNTDSDVSAYTMSSVRSRFYYRYAGDVMGGTRVDDYNALAASLRAVPAVCR